MKTEKHLIRESSDKALRNQLGKLMKGGDAHRPVVELMREFPYDKTGVIIEGLPYSVWSLVEHMRISQIDIMEFSRNPDYQSPEWPGGYWPLNRIPDNEGQWKNVINQFSNDLKEMIKMVKNPANDLFTPFPHGEGQTLFREAVMLAEHNSYHIGQVTIIGRQLGVW